MAESFCRSAAERAGGREGLERARCSPPMIPPISPPISPPVSPPMIPPLARTGPHDDRARGGASAGAAAPRVRASRNGRGGRGTHAGAGRPAGLASGAVSGGGSARRRVAARLWSLGIWRSGDRMDGMDWSLNRTRLAQGLPAPASCRWTGMLVDGNWGVSRGGERRQWTAPPSEQTDQSLDRDRSEDRRARDTVVKGSWGTNRRDLQKTDGNTICITLLYHFVPNRILWCTAPVSHCGKLR